MTNVIASATKTETSIKLKFVINVTPKLINPMIINVAIKLMVLPMVITPFSIIYEVPKEKFQFFVNL